MSSRNKFFVAYILRLLTPSKVYDERWTNPWKISIITRKINDEGRFSPTEHYPHLLVASIYSANFSPPFDVVRLWLLYSVSKTEWSGRREPLKRRRPLKPFSDSNGREKFRIIDNVTSFRSMKWAKWNNYNQRNWR